jgi:ABC-type Fe3+ transport system permease subunit
MRPSWYLKVLFAIFSFLFLAPYLWVLPRASLVPIHPSYLIDSYMFSFLQALLSTLFTLVGAIGGALGLFWLEARWSPRRYSIVEFIILLPALLPALFLVVPLLNILPFFPFGLPGVVIFHALAEVGIISLVLKKMLLQRLAPFAEMAEISGSSSLFFLNKAAPLMRGDIWSLAIILLIYYLTSFSIPLLIGGSSFSSLEVTIFEKLVVLHDWPRAINLFIYQFICIGFLLVLFSFFRTTPIEIEEKVRLRILEKPLGLIATLFPPALIVFGLLGSLPKGISQLMLQPYVMDNWSLYLLGSLMMGFVTAGSVFVALTVTTYFLQMKSLRYFFFIFLTPSFVILAFSFSLLPGNHPSVMLVKIAWALTVAFLPTLLRFGLLQKMNTLDGQLEMASYMGGSPNYVFKKITWPQCLPLISMMSGLAGVWAVGDFAFSRVIAGRDVNLAMWVQSLVDQYRWDMALVLSWLLLACALVVFGFFWSLSYVSRQKLS